MRRRVRATHSRDPLHEIAMPNALEFQRFGCHGCGCRSTDVPIRSTNAVLGMELSTPGGLKPARVTCQFAGSPRDKYAFDDGPECS
jgi:hypothetical protein